MSTTTIRIDEQLKARIGNAATQAGKTAHAFILEALTQKLDQVEQDNAFPGPGRQALGAHTRHGPDRGLGRSPGLSERPRPGPAPPRSPRRASWAHESAPA